MSIPFDPHPAFSDYAHPHKLVSASWLSARLGTKGLKVVESDADALLYDIGHIPGAMRIDWHSELNDPTVRDFISPEAFASLMSAKGISPDDTVVVYGDKSNWWASFTLWVFELFGHRDVRLLNGGRDAWMAEERDTSYAVPELGMTDYPVPTRRDGELRIFVDELKNSLGQLPIIDVRTASEYSGDSHPDDRYTIVSTMRGGHIPTAIHVPWADTVYPNSRFRPRAELEKLYEKAGNHGPAVVYCTVGDRSAHSWFVLTHLLGWEGVKNYDGSWVEWGNMVQMPIVRGNLPGEVTGGTR